MHTAAPLGTALPVTGRPEVFTRARDGRRPTVSDLFDGVHHHRIVAVYVPIERGGEVRYVMTVALPVSTFSAVLRAQPFVRGSVATLQDRQHVVLARTRAEEEMVGRRAEDPTAGHEGWVRSHQRDGQDVYVAFATAPLSGWRIVITSTVASVEAPLRRALGQLLVGGAVAAALASALAFVFGRRIAGAVGSLVRIARAVERGQRAQPLRTGVTEVNALAEQLRAAADRARKREEEAATREHQARAIGEVAHALNASPDLDAVLRSAVEAVHNLVHADSARIALVEEAGAPGPPLLDPGVDRDASGLRHRARPRPRRSGAGHGPSGADRRLHGRPALSRRPLHLSRADGRHRLVRGRADRDRRRGRRRDLRQQLHAAPVLRARRGGAGQAGRPHRGGHAEGAVARRRARRPVGGGSGQPGQG